MQHRGGVDTCPMMHVTHAACDVGHEAPCCGRAQLDARAHVGYRALAYSLQVSQQQLHTP